MFKKKKKTYAAETVPEHIHGNRSKRTSNQSISVNFTENCIQLLVNPVLYGLRESIRIHYAILTSLAFTRITDMILKYSFHLNLAN